MRYLNRAAAFLKRSASCCWCPAWAARCCPHAAAEISTPISRKPRASLRSKIPRCRGRGRRLSDRRRQTDAARAPFIASNALTLSAADTATLDKLGIATVYDLRTPGEIARTGGCPAGRRDIADARRAGYAATSSRRPSIRAGAAVAFMEGAGALLCHRRRTARELRRAPHAISPTAPARSYFIRARVRIAPVGSSALLLSIANVPLDVITQDYLLSNVYLTLVDQGANRHVARAGWRRRRDGRNAVAECPGELSAGRVRSGAGELRHDDQLSDARPRRVAIDDRYVARPARGLSAARTAFDTTGEKKSAPNKRADREGRHRGCRWRL